TACRRSTCSPTASVTWRGSSGRRRRSSCRRSSSADLRVGDPSATDSHDLVRPRPPRTVHRTSSARRYELAGAPGGRARRPVGSAAQRRACHLPRRSRTSAPTSYGAPYEVGTALRARGVVRARLVAAALAVVQPAGRLRLLGLGLLARRRGRARLGLPPLDALAHRRGGGGRRRGRVAGGVRSVRRAVGGRARLPGRLRPV